MKTGWVIAGVLLLVVGFFAGRSSVHLDDAKLQQQLADYRASLKSLAASWTEIWKRHAADSVRISAAEARGGQARAAAARHMASADSAKESADQAELELAASRTAQDSLDHALQALKARGVECRQCRAANDSLKRGAAEDSIAKVGLRSQIADLIIGHRDDSTAVAGGAKMIGKLEKQVRGCRLPFLGFPCPEPMAGIELSHRTLDAGAALPINLGRWRVRVFVTKQIAGLKQ